MKVSRKDAVAFFVALGYEKSVKWDDEKLVAKLKATPGNVEPGDVPDGREELYRSLCNADGKISLEGGAAESEGDAKPKGKKKEAPAEEPASEGKKKKKAAEPAEEPEGEPASVSKKSRSKKKTPKPEKEAVERDSMGCAMGTVSQQVNAAVSDDWKTEQEIAEEAKVSLDQARGRLYYAQTQNLFEHRRLIQYRLKQPEKPAKDGAKKKA